MINTSALYRQNFESTYDVVVNQGGTSSGKTYAILQVLFSKAIAETCTITIVGQDIPNLKVGALRDAIDIHNADDAIKQQVVFYNRSDRVFTFKNGSIMEFNSYDNDQDAKSGKRDYLFINEANGIPYNVYEQLSLRTRKQVYIDYNPDASFWVHERIIPLPNTHLIISDHRHNPFLSDKIRDKIEALKNNDIDLWKVYARGRTGRIEGLVLRKWFVTNEDFSDKKLIGYGMDFGFSNDPSSLVEVRMQDGELWVKELIYDTAMTNADISNRMETLNVSKGSLIVADSSEPKSIEEIRRTGQVIKGVRKGADSINFGIQIMQSQSYLVTSKSSNLIKELRAYCWDKDRTGKQLSKPTDSFNHAVDAVRYHEMESLGRGANFGKYTIS